MSACATGQDKRAGMCFPDRRALVNALRGADPKSELASPPFGVAPPFAQSSTSLGARHHHQQDQPSVDLGVQPSAAASVAAEMAANIAAAKAAATATAAAAALTAGPHPCLQARACARALCARWACMGRAILTTSATCCRRRAISAP